MGNGIYRSCSTSPILATGSAAESRTDLWEGKGLTIVRYFDKESFGNVLVTNFRIVASLDRKRLGTKVSRKTSWTRGVFDEEASRKPLAFAADALSYGI